MQVENLSVLHTVHIYPPGNITGTHLRKWKIQMKSSGIEPATCRLEA